MTENENPHAGDAPVPKKLDKKTLMIVAAFVGGLGLLIALNMK